MAKEERPDSEHSVCATEPLFEELYRHCETANELSKELRKKLKTLSVTEREKLVTRNKNGVTPLFLASRRGIVDIVNYLVSKCKADVDQDNKGHNEIRYEVKVTAVMVAQNAEVARCLVNHGAGYLAMAILVHICKSRFEVADYLVSQGTDLNDAEPCRYMTCLEFVGNNRQMYQIFLRYGANVNHQNKLLETPLHIAVRLHKLWQVQHLLLYGADPKIQNRKGDDVLQFTCRCGHEDIFEYLMDHVEYSFCTKATAHELMGAFYVSKVGSPYNPKIIDHWRTALRIRLNNGGPFLERDLSDNPPITDVEEFRTEADLEAMSLNMKPIYVQGLLINYRAFGYEDQATFYNICNVLITYRKNSEFKEFLHLVMYMIYRYVANAGLVSEATREMSIIGAHVFFDLVDSNGVQHVVIFFDDALTIVEFLWEQLATPIVDVKVYVTIAALLDLLLQVPKMEDQPRRMYRMVSKMVKKKYCNRKGRSVLHIVARIKGTQRLTSPIGHRANLDILLSPVVELLLDCGHQVDALDNFGSSPLHFAARSECDVKVVRCLLEHGAHIDRIDAKGIRPRQLLDAVLGLDTFKYMTLKCLAAKTIVDCGVPYQDLKFPALAEFISMH